MDGETQRKLGGMLTIHGIAITAILGLLIAIAVYIFPGQPYATTEVYRPTRSGNRSRAAALAARRRRRPVEMMTNRAQKEEMKKMGGQYANKHRRMRGMHTRR